MSVVFFIDVISLTCAYVAAGTVVAALQVDPRVYLERHGDSARTFWIFFGNYLWVYMFWWVYIIRELALDRKTRAGGGSSS